MAQSPDRLDAWASEFADNAIKSGDGPSIRNTAERKGFVESALKQHYEYFNSTGIANLIENIQKGYFPEAEFAYDFGLPYFFDKRNPGNPREQFISGFIIRSKSSSNTDPVVFVGFGGNADDYKKGKDSFVTGIGVSYQASWDSSSAYRAAWNISTGEPDKWKAADLGRVGNHSVAYDEHEVLTNEELRERLRSRIVRQLEEHGHKPVAEVRRPALKIDYSLFGIPDLTGPLIIGGTRTNFLPPVELGPKPVAKPDSTEESAGKKVPVQESTHIPVAPPYRRPVSHSPTEAQKAYVAQQAANARAYNALPFPGSNIPAGWRPQSPNGPFIPPGYRPGLPGSAPIGWRPQHPNGPFLPPGYRPRPPGSG